MGWGLRVSSSAFGRTQEVVLRTAALRGFGIVMVAVAAVLNLMGGVGTSCVALWAERFGPRMAMLAPYRWLYLGFVVAGIATAVWEAIAVVSLARRTTGGLRQTVMSLGAGLLVAGTHALASQWLRGSSAPADMRAYLTGAALLAVVLIGRTGAYAAERGGTPNEPAAGGVAMLSAGLLVLGTPHLVAATHTIGGVNLASGRPIVWAVGGALALAGGLRLVRTLRPLYNRRSSASMPSGLSGDRGVTAVTQSSRAARR